MATFEDYFREGVQLEVKNNDSYTMVTIEDDENVSTIALSNSDVKKLIEALQQK